jgi:hypothetical protein
MITEMVNLLELKIANHPQDVSTLSSTRAGRVGPCSRRVRGRSARVSEEVESARRGSRALREHGYGRRDGRGKWRMLDGASRALREHGYDLREHGYGWRECGEGGL